MHNVDEKLSVYISIPITGHDIRKVREKADRMKAMLSRAGYRPVSPLDIYPGKNPDYEDHICFDLRALLDCDAVLFCLGWESSLGCSIEYDVVMDYKLFGRKKFLMFCENCNDTIDFNMPMNDNDERMCV